MAKYVLQLSQFFHWLHAGPEIFRVFRVAKTTNPAHGKIKRFNGRTPGCITNVRELFRFHTAQKHQGQVQLIRPLPARTDDWPLNCQQLLFDGLRNFQPEEKAKPCCLIQPAPQTVPGTGAGNTVQSCRTHHARS